MTTAATTPAEATSAPILTPPNFPVIWEDAAEATFFWTLNRMHMPEPMTAADGAYFRYAAEGITTAARTYGYPLRALFRRINTFLYLAFVPSATPPDGAGARLGAATARLSELWRGEWLPEVQRYLADWESFDMRGAPLPRLVERVDQSLERTKRLCEIHFLIWFPMATAISSFDDLYRDLCGPAGGPPTPAGGARPAPVGAPGPAFDAYRLLQGFENKTIEGGRALWRLSRWALAVPAVRTVLETVAAADVPAALERGAEGRAFLTECRAFLDVWGRCADRAGWSHPSWIEDPMPVLRNLKDYVGQPDRDLDAELAAQVAQRERSVAEARGRLRGAPQPVREQFEFLLRAAQQAIVLTEDHAFWIDYCCTYQVRRVLLELGRRCAAAGVLDRAADVFLLTPAEARETAEALPRLARRPLAAARRAEMEYYRTIAAPPVLGTPPTGPAPADPLTVALGRFFGAPPPVAQEPGVIRGNPGAPGKAQGPARVIRSLAEAGTLRPGDVLVAETTSAPWTLLFATAAAVVTDTGGILSHSAIVAREYGIPAVVGTGRATAACRDGQLIEVDGDTGVVRLR